MMLLSQAAQAIGGKVIGNDARFSDMHFTDIHFTDIRFTGVSTDTRSITAGDLFVALREIGRAHV